MATYSGYPREGVYFAGESVRLTPRIDPGTNGLPVTAPSFSAITPLPSFLSLDPSSGVISGTVPSPSPVSPLVGYPIKVSLRTNESVRTTVTISTLNQPDRHLAAPRRGIAAWLVPGGKVIVLGGLSGVLPVPHAVEWFDPATNRVSQMAVPAASSFETASPLPDGRILLTGVQELSPSRRSVLLDPATGTCSGAGDNPLDAYSDQQATPLADGSVLLIGTRASGSTADNRLEAAAVVYEVTSGRFVAVGNPLYARRNFATSRLADGRILITGGTSSYVGLDQPVSFAETYDPASRRFSAAGSLGAPRVDHTSTLLMDGRVLLVGGGTDKLELFDPASGAFSQLASSGTSRAGHSAILLPSGKVLIIGGDGGVSPRDASPCLFDPVTQAIEATGPCFQSRRYETKATLLPDGRVLILGGGCRAVELYDPSTGTFKLNGE